MCQWNTKETSGSYTDFIEAGAVSENIVLILFRDFLVGTTVALCVISSSRKVDPSFEEYLKTTVLGNQF